MHEEWEIRSLPNEETLEKAWRNLKEKIGSEMRVFGRWRDRAIEREIERNEVRIAWGRIYKTLLKLDRWRCWARCRGFGCWQIQVSSKCQGVKTSNTKDEARLIHPVSRSYRGDKNFLDRSTRCWGVELAFKIIFFEKRKTQTWMQSSMQLNQWSKHHINLSKSSFNSNFKHMDPKHTHTHTKQV